MFGTQNLGLFVTAGLLLNVMPGPDTMYILGRTIAQGRRAGVASVLGIGSGCLVHTVLAAVGVSAVGVSAVLAASPAAFDVIRYGGAAYVAYLGVRMALDRSPLTEPTAGEPGRRSAWRIYGQGVLTNVLNPKVALFFLAFLPQFVDPGTKVKALPMLFLGAVFAANGMLWCLALVFFASTLSKAIRRGRGGSEGGGATLWIRRGVGALFVGLGIKLAVSR